jgi:hypothetical protein
MNNVTNINSEESFIRVYLSVPFFELHCPIVMCIWRVNGRHLEVRGRLTRQPTYVTALQLSPIQLI